MSDVRYKMYERNEFMIVKTSRNLTRGQNYTLKTTFYGELTEGLAGLYRSNYVNAAGETV